MKSGSLFKECSPGGESCDYKQKYDDLLKRFAMALWNGRIRQLCPVYGGYECPLGDSKKCYRNEQKRASGTGARSISMYRRELRDDKRY